MRHGPHPNSLISQAVHSAGTTLPFLYLVDIWPPSLVARLLYMLSLQPQLLQYTSLFMSYYSKESSLSEAVPKFTRFLASALAYMILISNPVRSARYVRDRRAHRLLQRQGRFTEVKTALFELYGAADHVVEALKDKQIWDESESEGPQ